MEAWHPLPAEPEHVPVLAAGRHLELRDPVEDGHVDLGAERGLGEGERDSSSTIGPTTPHGCSRRHNFGLDITFGCLPRSLNGWASCAPPETPTLETEWIPSRLVVVARRPELFSCYCGFSAR